MTASALVCGGWVLAFAALVLGWRTHQRLRRDQRAVAQAAHELRGPLGVVALAVDYGIRAGQIESGRLGAIALELERAKLALDDLTAPRARDTQVGFLDRRGVAQLDITELLHQSVEAWRVSAQACGTDVVLRWSGPRGLVAGQRPRLAQALGNLIANALEHGAGPVEVRGQLLGGFVRIELLDRGPGLPAPIAELARPSRGRHGHGLSVARAVLLAHGGRLGAAPSERGARVVLELPATAVAGSGLAAGADSGELAG